MSSTSSDDEKTNEDGEEVHFKDVPELEWLKKCGVLFTDEGYPFFKYPANKIKDKLQKWTEKIDEDDLNTAIKSLNDYLSNARSLKFWLKIPKGSLKSLPSILMENKRLQTAVFKYLCQYISLTYMDTTNEIPLQITQEILRDMKYHSRIYENEKVTEALFDAVNNAKENLRPLIISSLNEIIDCSPKVIESLLDIMVQTPQYTKDVLGAFESFQLSDTDKEEIRKKVLNDTLSAVNPSDLNVVIQFLMDTTDKTNAKETVDAFRENIVVSSEPRDDDDSDIFLILILKNSLKVNSEFATQYLKSMQEELELKVTDVWVLFCLFDITSRRNETMTAIGKLVHSGVLNEDIIKESIINHGKALESITRPITDLINWMLESNVEEILETGDHFAYYLFEEIKHPGVQQDIIASLLQQIGIGDDINKVNAVTILDKMSKEFPEKMAYHSHILEAPLFSYQSMNLDIFKMVVSVIVRLTFVDQQSIEANSGSQLHVFLRKMLNKSISDSTKYGIIVASAILKRYAEVCVDDPQPIQKHFSYIIDMTEGEWDLTSLLYQELSIDRPNSPALNQMLYTRLKQSLDFLIARDNDERIERYGLSEVEGAIQFYEAVTQAKVKRTLTLTGVRNTSGLRSSAYIFTRGALRLFLESADRCDADNEHVYELPLRIFNGSGEDLTRAQSISVLYLAHNWITDLLNHFGDTKIDTLWKRLHDLIEIDDMLVSAFKEEDSSSTTYELIPKIPKADKIAKKASQQVDKSSFFINELRRYFISPRLSLVMMILEMKLPLDDEKLRFLSRLLYAYEYIITPPPKKRKGSSASSSASASSGGKDDEDPLFPLEIIKQPPLEIIHFICNTLLPEVLQCPNELAPTILIQIINVITVQFSLPIYKKEDSYSELLESVCNNRSKKKCFKFFAEMIDSSQPIEVQFALIKLINTILHSGSSRINKTGEEVQILNQECKRLLQSSTPVLPVKFVKPTLTMFFELNADPLEDVKEIASHVLKAEIYKGEEKNEDWPSLVESTAPYFFQLCFQTVNKSLHEIAIKSKKAQNIDEESILAILNRLINLGDYTKMLLFSTAAYGIPTAVMRISIKMSDNWLIEVIQLLDFLKESYEVSPDMVKKFETTIRTVRKYVYSKIRWVRDNSKEKSLVTLLPSVSKNITQVAYGLRQVIKATEGSEGLRLQTMQDRDLEGNFVD